MTTYGCGSPSWGQIKHESVPCSGKVVQNHWVSVAMAIIALVALTLGLLAVFGVLNLGVGAYALAGIFGFTTLALAGKIVGRHCLILEENKAPHFSTKSPDSLADTEFTGTQKYETGNLFDSKYIPPKLESLSPAVRDALFTDGAAIRFATHQRNAFTCFKVNETLGKRLIEWKKYIQVFVSSPSFLDNPTKALQSLAERSPEWGDEDFREAALVFIKQTLSDSFGFKKEQG